MKLRLELAGVGPLATQNTDERLAVTRVSFENRIVGRALRRVPIES
ncbi:hypothetical protein [Enhygromyxa salina]|uniref:Uncharacterized protein n=1 Tax=Enhygromyxa salina TaxID=215803 RepID=A0A2S9YYE6_9BACT|nr:hypothetical protein [Enhygromyxa salina]PRQ10118.1 hypothetical protein ENSA7_01630 [Enhygromyxa salina]